VIQDTGVGAAGADLAEIGLERIQRLVHLLIEPISSRLQFVIGSSFQASQAWPACFVFAEHHPFECRPPENAEHADRQFWSRHKVNAVASIT